MAQRVELAPGLIILRIVPDNLPFEFTAGRYVVLGLKASAPRIDEAEADEVSFAPPVRPRRRRSRRPSWRSPRLDQTPTS